MKQIGYIFTLFILSLFFLNAPPAYAYLNYQKQIIGEYFPVSYVINSWPYPGKTVSLDISIDTQATQLAKMKRLRIDIGFATPAHRVSDSTIDGGLPALSVKDNFNRKTDLKLKLKNGQPAVFSD